MSPAFLIRINASLDYASDSENIYEEIRDDNKNNNSDNLNVGSSGGSGSGAGGGSDGLKGLFQRAKDTVRRSSRSNSNHFPENLSSGGELSAFHMSISKGRKKTLIDRVAFDWDCGEGAEEGEEEEEEGVGEETERREVGDKTSNQIKLDVEVNRKILCSWFVYRAVSLMVLLCFLDKRAAS